jgi:hypothetical protein
MSVARRLWLLRYERPLLVIVSVATVTAMVVWPVVDGLLHRIGAIHASPYGFNDFGVYSQTVDAWLDGGEIYVENEGGGYHGSFLYPPFVVPIFYPFVQLGFEAGPVLFGVLSLFLLWVGLEGVAETFGARLAVPERIVLLFALFGFHPALWDFKWGQVSTLLAAIICFAYLAHERGERAVGGGGRGSAYLSGALTTLGTTAKLFYMTAGAHLLRDGRRLAGAVATGLVLLAGSVLVFGVDTHLAYLDVLTWGKGWGTGQLPPRGWQTAYYRPLYLLDQAVESLGVGVPNVWIVGATVLGIFGVIALSLAARGAPAAARPTFALGVAVVPLLAPRAYTHDLVVLLLPALILLGLELDREDGLAWVPVLAVLLLHFHSPGTKLAIHLLGMDSAVLLQPGVYATYMLVGLAAARVADYASIPGYQGLRRPV